VTGGAHYLQTESSSASDRSDLESDSNVDDVVYYNNAESVLKLVAKETDFIKV
jgi:hypothetical protein